MSAIEALHHKYLDNCTDDDDFVKLLEEEVDEIEMEFPDDVLLPADDYEQYIINFIYYKDLLSRRVKARNAI